MNVFLVYFAYKYQGNWDQIYNAVDCQEYVSINDLLATEKRIENEGWKIITISDFDYPEALKSTYKPPFVLWYRGSKEFLNHKFLCVTGEQINDITLKRINDFIPKALKSFKLAVPGFREVDQVILKSFTDVQKLIILDCGFNYFGNQTVSSQDFLLSEYPPHAPFVPFNLRMKHRLVASICQSVVLFSSNEDCEITQIVNSFLERSKNIFCFPDDGIESSGNSQLIRKGAQLITKIEDL